MKKIRQLFALALFCLTCIGANAEIVSGKCGTNVTWSYDSSTGIFTISGTGPMKTFSPTAVNQRWYMDSDENFTDYNKSITKVVVEEGVTTIGGYAFYTEANYYENGGYPKLKEIVLPSTLDSIHGGAFTNCEALEKVTFGGNEKFIGNSAFYGCTKLNNVELPNTMQTLSESSFRKCTSLTTISLGTGVKNIGRGAFYECSSLKNISIPSSVVTIGNLAFYKTAITSLDLSNATNLSGELSFDTNNNNTVYFVPSGKTITNTKNIIINGTCANLELTDGYDFAPSSTFTATSASYSRTMTDDWGTVCLPYSVASNSSVAYYKITRIQGNTLVLELYETLPAGTPALVKRLSGSGIAPTATSVNICTSAGTLTGTVNMYGSFTNNTKVTASNAYYLKDGKFYRCNNYFYIDAFRAYFTVDSSAKEFDLEEADATSIDFSPLPCGESGGFCRRAKCRGSEGNVYNLQGMKVDENYKGIVIKNGKKFLIK